MDALGELVCSALELVVEVLPLRVSAVIVVDVAAMYFAAVWVAEHEASPAADWVAVGAFIALPIANVLLLAWRAFRKEREPLPEPPCRIHVGPARPRGRRRLPAR